MSAQAYKNIKKDLPPNVYRLVVNFFHSLWAGLFFISSGAFAIQVNNTININLYQNIPNDNLFFDINKQVVDVNRPITDINRPITDINKPITDINKPITDINKSTTDINKLITDVNKPIIDVNKSTTDVNKLITDVNKSFIDVNKSIRERIFSLLCQFYYIIN